MTENKSIQLVRAAKELNVGLHTIIDHLADKGHVVENKPSTKLTEEQYNILLSAFKQDLAIKKKAEEVEIGKARKDKAEEVKEETIHVKEQVVERPRVVLEGPKVVGNLEPNIKKSAVVEPEIVAEKPAEPKETPVSKEEAPIVEEVKSTPKKEVEIPAPKEVEVENRPTPKVEITVVDKIDLEEKKQAPKIEKKPIEKPIEKIVKKETTAEIAPKVEEVKTPEASKNIGTQKTEEDSKASGGDSDEVVVIRAEAEKLTGPKVVGRLDLPTTKKSSSDKKPFNKSNDEKKKRKRIAGKVVDVNKVVVNDDKGSGSSDRTGTNKPQGQQQGGGNNRNAGPNRGGGNNRNAGPNRGGGKFSRNDRKQDEPQAVSGKEIDDKIRATMAKLGAGNRSKSNKSKHRKSRREDNFNKEEGDEISKIQVTEFISVSELANIMDVSPTQVISACFGLGIIVSINQRIDAEVIELVAGEFGYDVEFINIAEEEEEIHEEDREEDLLPRSPIVTIMGHVDHGKTSLLDYIRRENIVAGEAGGITQHIGAYEVTLPENNKKVTFLDTPGHEAFTAMRARGAKLTDIVVIVVAADDNVMPQTKEAFSHAQAAEVPMIIAINKIDKPTANPENIKKQLAEMNILVEDWGGKYQCQEISAKKGVGVDELLEKILLEAELLELKANPNKMASGSVIEASLDKGRGYVSTIMVQEGTLNIGDFVVAGQHFGRVKALTNERGVRVKKAGPSQPVQLLGLSGAPTAGDKFKVYATEQEAKEIANKRATILREQGIRAQKHITLDEIGRRLALGNFKELKIIVKGDVDGSVQALSDSLLQLSTEEIQVSIVLSGVGAITENDVLLATASDAIIVAFQVRPTANARNLAEKESIEIRNYSIIYDAIDDVKKAMEGMLEPKFEEKVVAEVEVREIFKIGKVGTIAGCYVQDGKITRTNKIRVIRDGIVIHSGQLDALKRFKDDVKDVAKGYECGIKIKNFNDIKEGDIIESYELVEVKRKL
ncbi:MAG: translation initiation factor IF-2 [Chitinophagales bacterium]|nr:translation initiation factor IF-2 [Chitinophagales bacterium]